MRSPTRSTAASIAAAALCAGGLVAATAPAAFAADVGGNCNATREQRAKTGPDEHRVRARCSSLLADSKARGTLAINVKTPYFTGLNNDYYSPWAKFVVTPKAKVEFARV